MQFFEALLQILKWTLWVVIPGLIAFFASLYWFDEDRRAESFDEDCRTDIRQNPAFRGLNGEYEVHFIATSDSHISKATTKISQYWGKVIERPQKFVPVDNQPREERQKTFIFERFKEDLPGKNLLKKDLLASLRNYYSYKLALSQLGHDSEVTKHFKERFEEYEYSKRVKTLSRKEYFEKVSLIDYPDEEYDALRDVFIPLLRGAENHVVKAASDVEEKEREIERCREFMMESFWRLYQGENLGLLMSDDGDLSEYVNSYRTDIRENDHICYWLLPEGDCSQSDYGRFQNMAYKIQDVLDEYWNEENFESLHPKADSIPDMDYVESPFIVFRKDLEAFNHVRKPDRIKNDPRFRKRKDRSE